MFAYLDNVAVGGASEAELERNQAKFLDAARRKTLPLTQTRALLRLKTDNFFIRNRR